MPYQQRAIVRALAMQKYSVTAENPSVSVQAGNLLIDFSYYKIDIAALLAALPTVTIQRLLQLCVVIAQTY